MADQFNGAIDLRVDSVRNFLNGGEALGYEARKAEKFFTDDPEAKDYVKDLIKHVDLKTAQGRFENYCKWSKSVRPLIKDMFLEEIKNKASKKEVAFA
jgi:hypothetical protein